MKKAKVFVFDFDGTLCDSFDIVARMIQEFSQEFASGAQSLSTHRLEDLKEFSMKELFRQAKIPSYRIPQIVRKIRKDLHGRMDEMKPFDGVQQALVRLKNKGVSVGVLTSNSKENVVRFAKNHSIDTLDFIHSGSNLFGKDKVIKKLMRSLQVTADQMLYVGDETRDIEACRAAGVRMIAVTWGYNSKKLLESFDPDYLIQAPEDLDQF